MYYFSLYYSQISERDPQENIADKKIDFINMKRNIPSKITEEQKLLYNYSQHITPKILKEITIKKESKPVENIERCVESIDLLLKLMQKR